MVAQELQHQIESGIITVTFAGGLMTEGETFKRNIGLLFALGQNGGIDAVVLDLRRPIWAVTVDQLMAAGIRSGGPSPLPVAMVTSGASFDLFKEFAWAAAQRGVLRRVFTEMEPALSWARLRQRLVRQQRTAP